MPIPSLSGSYIDQTYQRLVQTQGGEFADGLGNPITFGTTPTGSLLTTASAAGNTITFTKGDGTTFPVTVSGTSIDTSSFATTGSNIFRGNQVISGSLTVFTGSGIEFQVTNTGTRIGNALSDVHIVTGSLRVNGSITGSLFGTASFANNANFATSAGTANTANLALSVQGGSTNYIPLWTSTTNLGISDIYQNGSLIGIGTTDPSYTLDIRGATGVSGDIVHVNNVYKRLTGEVASGGNSGLFEFDTTRYNSVFINYHIGLVDNDKIISSRAGHIKASFSSYDSKMYYTENTTQDFVNINYNVSTENVVLSFLASKGEGVTFRASNTTNYTALIKGEYLLVEKSL